MNSNDKNNFDHSNDISGENNFLNENIDDFIINDDQKQDKVNEPLYKEITSEKYEDSNQYKYSESIKGDDKRKDNTAHDLAITSMILGIVSVVCSLICCCSIGAWMISIICAIVGIILGAIAKDSKGKREGMAIAGIICSAIGIAISVIFLILLAVGVYADSMGYFN